MESNPYQYSLTTRLKDRILFKMMDPQPGESILDVGCGLGFFVDFFSRSNARSFGIDLSHPSLVYVKRSIPGFFIRGSAMELPFETGTFDKILFTDVIEHLEDDRAAVMEISRVLKDNGEVVITTPFLGGRLTGGRLNRLFHDVPGAPEYHERDGYSLETLEDLLNECSMNLVEVKYSTFIVTELFIEVLKLFYHFVGKSQKEFASQADALEVNKSILFQIYRRFCFPIMLLICRAEEKLFGRFLKGHMILVKGRVKKAN